MKAFRVRGQFQMGQSNKQPFVKQFAAENEDEVRERVVSDLGSRHGVSRRQIHIEEIGVIPEDEDLDPVVRYAVEKAGA